MDRPGDGHMSSCPIPTATLVHTRQGEEEHFPYDGLLLMS